MEVPMIGLSPALEGLTRSETQLNQAASDIARATLAPTGHDTVDLSSTAVAVLQAHNSFEANTKMIKVADQMDQTLLSAVG
jgi:flagellar hook protein FlgE